MEVQAQASYLYLYAIFRSVCESSQGEIPNALDGYAGDDSEDRKEDEGGEVQEDYDPKYEGRI